MQRVRGISATARKRHVGADNSNPSSTRVTLSNSASISGAWLRRSPADHVLGLCCGTDQTHLHASRRRAAAHRFVMPAAMELPLGREWRLHSR